MFLWFFGKNKGAMNPLFFQVFRFLWDGCVLFLIENKDHLGVIIGIKKRKASSLFFGCFELIRS